MRKVAKPAIAGNGGQGSLLTYSLALKQTCKGGKGLNPEISGIKKMKKEKTKLEKLNS